MLLKPPLPVLRSRWDLPQDLLRLSSTLAQEYDFFSLFFFFFIQLCCEKILLNLDIFLSTVYKYV